MLFKHILLDYKINQTNKPVDLESLDELTDLMNTETVT